MDPLFVATPDEAEIAESLRMWPELGDMRIRPLLVSAFGDIFFHTDAGEVWVGCSRSRRIHASRARSRRASWYP